MPWTNLVIAPSEHKGSILFEPLHSTDGTFGGVDVSLTVEGQKVRAADTGWGRDVSTEFTWLDSVLAPSPDRLALGRQSLHASIDLIGDENRSVRPECNTTRLLKFPGSGSQFAELSDQLACLVINANL